MSESNNNWVCFECRFLIRQAKTYAAIPKCQHCHQDCVCVGYKRRIPKKRDVKGWEQLNRDYRQIKLHRLEAEKASIRFRITHLKDEIQRLLSKEENKDRNRLINAMKDELDRIQNSEV